MNMVNLNSASLNSKRLNVLGEIRSSAEGGGGDLNKYLTFVALEDGLMVQLSRNACEYCIDGDGNWMSLSSGTYTETVNKGQTLSFRGNITNIGTSAGIGRFSCTKSCNVQGNVMSLLYGDNEEESTIVKSYCFQKLFYNCSTLIDASFLQLPATTLANRCYYSMFSGCTSLVSAPELPATTLASDCYYSMFSGCTSLVSAPELPATTLASSCYNSMFSGCTSLVSAPELPVTTLASSCYNSMFSGCTSLVSAPELPATTLASNCYNNMFSGCTSLVSAPELPATTLASNCYNNMFSGCTSLVSAPELPATYVDFAAYHYMFFSCSNLSYVKCMAEIFDRGVMSFLDGVAESGKFVKSAKATWDNATIGIPEGWEVITE